MSGEEGRLRPEQWRRIDQKGETDMKQTILRKYAFLGECRALGVNDSMEHNDYMIGYEGLDIDAVTRDGRTVPIFRRGKWAF